jgi:adenosylhomocysteine nucleosidase
MKILIVTALSLEFEAAKAFLMNVRPVTHPSTGTIYDTGIYTAGEKTIEVYLLEAGAGNVRAAEETGRAIDFFKTEFVFFVGVAGGIKDVKLGDVVASTKIIGYEMGKDEEVFKPRPDTLQSSYRLEQLAKYVKREKVWQKMVKTDYGITPEAFVQPIAAGEKVVASERSLTYSYLKKYCSDAFAIEMEGNGFLVAARAHHANAIVVRGISDLIENKEQSDASGYQPIAADNAAAFAFAMIGELGETASNPKDGGTLEYHRALVEVLVSLYPGGPEEEDIWKRAGGDVSILINSSSRKSQWFHAVGKLMSGGGGKTITLSTLAKAIAVDHPLANLRIFESR